MKKALITGIFIVAVASLPGCYYDTEEALYPGNCDTVSVTYSGSVLRILEANCYACHSSAAAQGGIVLEGYDRVKTVAGNGRLLGAITHTSGFSAMPKNTGKMDACDIGTIRQWIAAGTVNN